ncbi:MAG: hypothetical protein F6K40_37240 [Okeania sp. SIO3I5]|uniref:hypothetical protein n=1 Tax=Okeania sp. SIO3I5 TaxID=2607805 RepID=UPI0013BB480A|nr:hypothetical protein [Okeania sp. SIO3I5]NEQ41539.1 hypothetical protein [Okeania sp. SIO3I5]
MKQIIYSGFLAILGMIASVDSASAQVQYPSDTFKMFKEKRKNNSKEWRKLKSGVETKGK